MNVDWLRITHHTQMKYLITNKLTQRPGALSSDICQTITSNHRTLSVTIHGFIPFDAFIEPFIDWTILQLWCPSYYQELQGLTN